MVRLWLFEKKLSLFKEVAIFSIIIIVFKIGVFGTVKCCFFRLFWFRTSFMGYVECESAKKMAGLRLFEKKLSLFKEVAIFSILVFKNGFYWIVKYCGFPAFLVKN